MQQTSAISSIAILGGSFNPLHLGHLRLAVEVYEAVGPGRVDFVPSASPPHKPGESLLPFDLRFAMLEAATASYPMFRVNPLEARREGFSYTADTLREYSRENPGAKLYFILGSEDYELLDTWKEWPILPELAELLVVARQGREVEGFAQTTRRLWPDAREIPPMDSRAQASLAEATQTQLAQPAERPAFAIGKAGCVSYLSVPRLDINASLIRSRWLWGRLIDFWVPPEILPVLRENSDLVRKHWLGQSC